MKENIRTRRVKGRNAAVAFEALLLNPQVNIIIFLQKQSS